MPISAAEMTAKSKKKKEIVQQIEQEMPEASDEEVEAAKLVQILQHRLFISSVYAIKGAKPPPREYTQVLWCGSCGGMVCSFK